MGGRDVPLAGEAARSWLDAMGAQAPADVAFAPTTLKQALDGALALGRAAGSLPAAMRVVAGFEARLAEIAGRLEIDRRTGLVGGSAAPWVAVVTGIDSGSLRLGGLWIPDVVAAAGGQSVLARAGAPDVRVAPERLHREAPALVVVALAGRDMSDAVAEWARLVDGGGAWPRTVCLDGRRFINEPSPRLLRSVELLAHALHGIGPTPAADEAATIGAAPA